MSAKLYVPLESTGFDHVFWPLVLQLLKRAVALFQIACETQHNQLAHEKVLEETPPLESG